MRRSFWIGCAFMAMMSLNSCFTEVDAEIPEQFPKLVVGCFINPDDLFITAVVKSSSPIFTSYDDIDINEILPNATVKISNGTSEVLIPYVEDEDLYQLEMSQFPISFGSTYTLTVSAPGYETVEAVTTVPNAPVVFSENVVLDVDTTDDDFSSYVDYSLRFKWNDPGGQENFYRIFVQETNSGAYYNIDKFIADEGEDGDLMSSVGTVRVDLFNNTDATFKAYMMNCSEDYFRYHRSLTNLTYGDPFAEPTLVYSNVKNGLGCFGGYALYQVVFTP